MSFPEYQEIEEPLLSYIYFNGGDSFSVKSNQTYLPLADYFSLSDIERKITRHEAHGDGRNEALWNNMVQWARRKLNSKGYLEKKAGYRIWKLSNDGIKKAESISFLHKGLNNSKNIYPSNCLDDLKNNISSFEHLAETEKKAIIDSRIGQGKFRSQLIDKWNCCSVTSCGQIDLLIASHIKPWVLSNNSERLDVNNGLLLLSNLDSVFDKGYITFNENGKIVFSSKLSPEAVVALNINDKMMISNINKTLLGFLEYHRRNVFIQ